MAITWSFWKWSRRNMMCKHSVTAWGQHGHVWLSGTIPTSLCLQGRWRVGNVCIYRSVCVHCGCCGAALCHCGICSHTSSQCLHPCQTSVGFPGTGKQVRAFCDSGLIWTMASLILLNAELSLAAGYPRGPDGITWAAAQLCVSARGKDGAPAERLLWVWEQAERTEREYAKSLEGWSSRDLERRKITRVQVWLKNGRKHWVCAWNCWSDFPTATAQSVILFWNIINSVSKYEDTSRRLGNCWWKEGDDLPGEGERDGSGRVGGEEQGTDSLHNVQHDGGCWDHSCALLTEEVKPESISACSCPQHSCLPAPLALRHARDRMATTVSLSLLFSDWAPFPSPSATPGAAAPSPGLLPCLDTLQPLSVLLVMRSPKVAPGFQVGLQQCQRRGRAVPWGCCHTRAATGKMKAQSAASVSVRVSSSPCTHSSSCQPQDSTARLLGWRQVWAIPQCHLLCVWRWLEGYSRDRSTLFLLQCSFKMFF